MIQKVENLSLNNKFNLSSYYLNDIWKLNQGENFNKLTDNQKRICIESSPEILDFSNCSNVYVREELKHYSYSILENKLIMTTFKNYAKAFIMFFEYINNNHKKIKSIVELKKEFLIKDYKNYLNEINIKTDSKRYYINENMEKSTTVMGSIYVSCIIYFYDYMYSYYFPNNKNEFEKDIWDIRNLSLVVNNDKSSPRYMINFERISQNKLKLLAKKFIYHRLSNISLSKCHKDLTAIILLSNFLEERYPDMQTLNGLDRMVIEDFIGFVKTEMHYKRNTAADRIGSIKIFFQVCQLMNWEGAPKEELIFRSDYSKRHRSQPKYYTDDELKNINMHLDKLPIQIARMFFVIESLGIRLGELCKLAVNCLEEDTKGEAVLSYFQTKTNKHNKIPINEEVKKTIEEAIKYSKKRYGENIKYVFSNDLNTPISGQLFNKHLNELSYENNILNRNGELLRISGSKFRGTVSTRYANLGLDYNIIMKLLGQSTPGILKHYVEIHDITVLNAMESIIEEQDELIINIGNNEKINIAKKEEKSLLSLSNGYCTKSIKEGKCVHANACYNCQMFKPDIRYLHLYKHHLREAQKNVKIAEINKFERILQMNKDLENNLIKIIDRVKQIEQEVVF